MSGSPPPMKWDITMIAPGYAVQVQQEAKPGQNAQTAARLQVRYGAFSYVHRCRCSAIRCCKNCRLEPGSEDLCKLKTARVHDRELLRNRQPNDDAKGFYPDFWIHRPSSKTTILNDNAKFLGLYMPESVQDAISEGIRVTPWEYRAYKEDPDTERRIYVGNDDMVKESTLANRQPPEEVLDSLVTPYDAGMDPEEDIPDPENADMWHSGGFIPAYIFSQTHRDRKMLVVPDGKDRPYYRWESVPALKPIGCKVEIKDGYVMPVGKHVKFSTIKTRADKKRARDRGEISRQKRAYYGYLIKKDAAEARTGKTLPSLSRPLSGPGVRNYSESPRIEPFVGRGQKEKIAELRATAAAP